MASLNFANNETRLTYAKTKFLLSLNLAFLYFMGSKLTYDASKQLE